MSEATAPLDHEPIPAPAGAEVAVLTHDHRHGVEVEVFGSYDAAQRARADIARDGWEKLATLVDDLPATPPQDDAEAAEMYFGHHDDEDASVRLLTVSPDPDRPSPAGDGPAEDPALAGLVAVLGSLSDRRAFQVLHSLVTARGWKYAIWTADDVLSELQWRPDWPAERTLSAEQHRAVQQTPAWRETLTQSAYQRVIDDEVLYDVLCQSGLICVDCDAVVGRPLTETWGRCDRCRTSRPLAEMRDEACPINGEWDHHWQGPACGDCGIPSPEQVTCRHCTQQVPLATAHWDGYGTWIDGACCWSKHLAANP
ncbi:hypothetical protein [Micromonospora sp. NPDC049662]|uniref:hypothetical protein n=1 Tax=Micromonospora sp. NPDC049662 TaxID=3155397 RepID=UPI00342C15E7